jgi:DNA-binding PadR family transcriptional regulator
LKRTWKKGALYELIILSLLVRFPAHGYLIAHIINDMIGPYARVSNGRLYPLLAKMEESGLIETREDDGQEQRGERNLRSYRITEEGRQRFHVLMMDTTSNLGEYQRLFHYKVPLLYLLQPSERLFLIEHYLSYCQAHVLHLTGQANDLATHGHTHNYAGMGASLAATLDVMKHMADKWRMDVEWTLRLHAEELARQEGAQEQTTDTTSAGRAPQKRMQNQNQNQNQNDNRHRNQN